MDPTISTTNEHPLVVHKARSRRVRQKSNLDGMFDDEPQRVTPTSPQEFAPIHPRALEDENGIQDFARRLRRTKRSLLLKSTEAPKSPVDQFRSIVMSLSSAPEMPGPLHHDFTKSPTKA